MTAEQDRAPRGPSEPPSLLLQPGERIVWSGRPIVLRTIRPVPVVVFLAGLALAIYGISNLSDVFAANRAFRGTAFESFMIDPSRAMLKPGLLVALGLLLAHFLPVHLWRAAGTRYQLSERRAFERSPGLLGPRHVAATIALSGEVAVAQAGPSYSLAFSAFTTTATEPFAFVFHNLSEPAFRQALAHIQAVTGRGGAESAQPASGVTV